MILLEKLLQGLDVGVETFAICLIDSGESLPVQASELPAVHYSLAGSGHLKVLGERIPFKKHSFVIMPAECALTIEADATSERSPGARAYCDPPEAAFPRTQEGTGSPAVVMACGRIFALYQHAIGLFDHLTEPLVDDFACDDGVCRPFDALLGELANPQPGTQALVDSLMQQCLVLLLRRYCASGECRLTWLNALEDPRLAKVVARVLDYPGQDVSLEQLAALSGMSRSAFAARFAEAFGRTPMEFVKETRLRRAAELLRNTDLPVKVVAHRVGYASRSYFSRAFKAHYRLDPAAFRRSGIDQTRLTSGR